jgi:sugar phosphate isomerase/epimerase
MKIIKELISKYNIKVLLDVGHLKVSSKTLNFDKYKFIDEYNEDILIVHLSDNNGVKDLGSKLNKKSWFWNHLNWKKIKYISLEIKNADINNLKKQIELTSRLINL